MEKLSLFEIENYRKIINLKLNLYPNRGYGVLKKIAEYLSVNSTFISQVIHGSKNFSMEQASLVCDFFGFTEIERKYFLLILQLERAGNESLRNFLKAEISEIRKQANKLSSRLPADVVLSENDKAIFYSKWYFSAVRQMIAINNKSSVEEIATSLGLPRKIVGDSIEFLLRTGLCKKVGNAISLGPSRTHLESDSHYVKTHHMNWRSKAMDLFDQYHPTNLHYSSPMTITKKDAQKIRTLLLDCIEHVGKTVDNSESEEFFCINVDWFKVSREE